MGIAPVNCIIIWPQEIIVHNYTPIDRTFIDCIASVTYYILILIVEYSPIYTVT